MGNDFPVILVHGLFGFGPDELGALKYWGSAFDVASPLTRRFEASVGPVGSAHDRACELAAQIKGSRVDYGEAHAAEFGHDRFGVDFEGKGFVTEWSEEHPIHVIGHSLGSPTVRCLQHLLSVDYWGWGSTHRWVHSLSTISGVSNGSTLVFRFGADEMTGLIARDSICAEILRLVELYTGATDGLVDLDSIYDFDLGHWGYKRREIETLREYLDRVADCQFLWGKDNAAYSLTLQGAYEDNAVWRTHDDAFYFSYITEKTWKDPLTERFHPRPTMQAGMQLPSEWIGGQEFTGAPIPVDDFKSLDWWENDGLVPTISQLYPWVSGEHPTGGEFDESTPTQQLQRGQWHWMWLRGMDHLDICLLPAPGLRKRQEAFYEGLFRRLAELPPHARS